MDELLKLRLALFGDLQHKSRSDSGNSAGTGTRTSTSTGTGTGTSTSTRTSSCTPHIYVAAIFKYNPLLQLVPDNLSLELSPRFYEQILRTVPGTNSSLLGTVPRNCSWNCFQESVQGIVPETTSDRNLSKWPRNRSLTSGTIPRNASWKYFLQRFLGNPGNSSEQFPGIVPGNCSSLQGKFL